MSLRDRFRREFRDLHGPEVVIEGEASIRGDWRRAPLQPTRLSLGDAVTRVAIGSLGLFWALVLGFVVLGLAILAYLAVSAALAG